MSIRLGLWLLLITCSCFNFHVLEIVYAYPDVTAFGVFDFRADMKVINLFSLLVMC